MSLFTKGDLHSSLRAKGDKSSATSAQLTSPVAKPEPNGFRKTDDFFPTLHESVTFGQLRMKHAIRMHGSNITALGGTPAKPGWIEDQVQVRRATLPNGFYRSQLFYGDDVKPLRVLLPIGDSLVLVRRGAVDVYEAFGVRNTAGAMGPKALLVRPGTKAQKRRAIRLRGTPTAQTALPTDLLGQFHEACENAGIVVSKALVRRFLAALLAKPFVVFTGLSGSGKTLLSRAFARWMAHIPAVDLSGKITNNVEVVAHGPVAYKLSVQGKSVLVPSRLIQEFSDLLRAGHTQAAAITQLSANADWKPCLDKHGKAIASVAEAAGEARVDEDTAVALVPVGSNWTSSEPLLGYADALREGRYQRTQTLDLVLRASADVGFPHFLLLDEMNLSQVERYFADFLSAMETGDPIPLHSQEGLPDGVPSALHLPPNLFVVGTVNVDETTYQFAPKVLDRAATIEFRMPSDAITAALAGTSHIEWASLDGLGAKHAAAFVQARAVLVDGPPAAWAPAFRVEMELLFSVLASLEREFGFRVVGEVSRFLFFFHSLDPDDGVAQFDAAMDAAIMQKVLPKLSGSRRVLEPVVQGLRALCYRPAPPAPDPAVPAPPPRDLLAERDEVQRKKAALAAIASRSFAPPGEVLYPVSADKLARMTRRLLAAGFTSFAEG